MTIQFHYTIHAPAKLDSQQEYEDTNYGTNEVGYPLWNQNRKDALLSLIS